MKVKVKKEIDLSKLPRNKQNNINWKESIGYDVYFKYDDIEDYVTITDYEIKNQTLTIKYKDKFMKINIDYFKKCQFGCLIGKINKDFKINIGEVLKSNEKDLIILDRKRIKNKKGCNEKFYKCRCNKCGYEIWLSERVLIGNKGCSCCQNRTVVKGINDIATTDPWMVKYFVNPEDAYKYVSKSSKRIKMKCPNCGRIKEKEIIIQDLYRNKKIGCICNDKISYSEKFIYNVLSQLNINFITQFNKSNANWCDKYRYDFYIPDKNIIIETHGLQHYVNSCWMPKKEQQKIDNIKRKLALNNNIKEYIQLDCSESDIKYITISLKYSKLSKYYDLSNVNWKNADEFATSNFVKKVCEYYEDNKNKMFSKDIAEKLNINITTLIKYLNQGNKFGWCKYEKNYGNKMQNKITNHPRGKKVKVIELNLDFKNCSECAKYLTEKYNKNFSSKVINSVCRKEKKSYLNFHFEYI